MSASTVLPVLLGSIPSPSSGTIHLGPLRLTAYGLMIALGVLAAVEISRRRAAARGVDPDVMSQIGVYCVIAGLLGARAYHVLTDLSAFRGNWIGVVKIWEGGLGIPGGLVAGTLAGAWVAKRNDLKISLGLDIAAPAVPAAQAIGRWGNWWNQELFGRPTSLPWGLRISELNRPAGYADVATFHPTFLYESLWNLALAGLIVWYDKRHPGRFRTGTLFPLYIAGYGLGRLWVEALRIDQAQYLFGVRFNLLVSLAAIGGGLLVAVLWNRGRPEPVVFASSEPAVSIAEQGGLEAADPEAAYLNLDELQDDAAGSETGNRVDDVPTAVRPSDLG